MEDYTPDFGHSTRTFRPLMRPAWIQLAGIAIHERTQYSGGQLDRLYVASQFRGGHGASVAY